MKSMSLFKIISSACLLLICYCAPAQWVNRFNGQGDFSDQFDAMTQDASGNLYLAGFTMNPDRNSDILVVKLNSAGDTVWTNVYDGPGKDRDEAQAITIDNSGNVYIAGFVKGATGYDFITIKYNSAGVIQWTASYTFTTDQTDQANSIAVDASGNVFVTGYSDQDASAIINYDYVVIKYGPSGNLLWTARKDGAGNAEDKPSKLVLDPSGNPVVTGRSFNGSDDDYLTIKYSSSNGALVWQMSEDRTHNDRATDMVINNSNGNIYVTGRSRNTNYDYLTVCYNSGGTKQWQAIYNNVDDDRATGIGLDGSGNIYVTGQSDADATANYNYDIATVKYNLSGVQQWVKTYAGAANNNELATGIFVDATGNCFVTGSTDTDPGVDSSYDYITLAYSSAGAALWSHTYTNSASSNDIPSAIVEDVSGNVIVTGSTETIPQRNGATIKYSSTGAVLWTKYYDGVGDNSDNANAIAIDASRNVFIAGYTVQYGMDRNFALQKIDPNGNTQWVRTLDGTISASSDIAYGVAVDGSGNIFVGGYTHNSTVSNDFTVAKYNTNGDTIWTRTYNYPTANESDKAVSLAIDGSGNVYLTGRSDNDPTLISNDDVLTVKWDGNGVLQWASRLNGTGNGSDAGRAIKVAPSGNIYVAGKTLATTSDYVLLKYNSSGVQQWIKTYDGGGSDDVSSMAIDNNENIYITGYSENISGSDTDIVTVKYNSSGVQQWAKRYDGTAHGTDKGNGIAVDASGNVIVTGSTDVDNLPATQNNDQVTLLYDASGTQQWAKTYDGTAHGNDEGEDVALDAQNNIYVTGSAQLGSANYDYAILKYNPSGTLLNAAFYNGTGNGEDIPSKILVGGSDVYVTGYSYGAGNAQRDMLTIKYSNGVLAVNDVSGFNKLGLYPNPVTNISMVDLGSTITSHTDDLSAIVSDLSGRVLRKINAIDPFHFEVEKGNLTSGLYFLTVSCGDHDLGVVKFSVQ